MYLRILVFVYIAHSTLLAATGGRYTQNGGQLLWESSPSQK